MISARDLQKAVDQSSAQDPQKGDAHANVPVALNDSGSATASAGVDSDGALIGSVPRHGLSLPLDALIPPPQPDSAPNDLTVEVKASRRRGDGVSSNGSNGLDGSGAGPSVPGVTSTGHDSG